MFLLEQIPPIKSGCMQIMAKLFCREYKKKIDNDRRPSALSICLGGLSAARVSSAGKWNLHKLGTPLNDRYEMRQDGGVFFLPDVHSY